MGAHVFPLNVTGVPPYKVPTAAFLATIKESVPVPHISKEEPVPTPPLDDPPVICSTPPALFLNQSPSGVPSPPLVKNNEPRGTSPVFVVVHSEPAGTVVMGTEVDTTS